MPFQIILMIHVALAVFLITIILLQHGKGADVGATFGGGGGSLFGAAGADNLLTKVTAFSAGGFMLTSLLLAVAQKPSLLNSNTVFDGLPSTIEQSAPAAAVNSGVISTEEQNAEGAAKAAANTSQSAASQSATVAQPTTTQSATSQPSVSGTSEPATAKPQSSPPIEAASKASAEMKKTETPNPSVAPAPAEKQTSSNSAASKLKIVESRTISPAKTTASNVSSNIVAETVQGSSAAQGAAVQAREVQSQAAGTGAAQQRKTFKSQTESLNLNSAAEKLKAQASSATTSVIPKSIPSAKTVTEAAGSSLTGAVKTLKSQASGVASKMQESITTKIPIPENLNPQ